MKNGPGTHRPSGVAFVVLTLLGWSSVPLFLKYFVGYIDGWTANGWRYAMAAMVWGPVLLIGAYRGTLPRGLWRAALVPSIFNCCGQSCFAWSHYYIDPGMLTFLLRFHIIFVTFGAYLLFATERGTLRSTRFWAGIAVVFVGSIGVVLLAPELPHRATAFGTALAILSGFFFAGYILSVRYFMDGVRSVTAFAAISSYTAAGLVTLMLLVGERSGLVALTLGAGQWGMLVVSALVGIAFAHVFYYAGLARLGVSVSSGIILLQPVLTSTASYFVFGEQLTVWQWLCGLAALAGAGLILSTETVNE